MMTLILAAALAGQSPRAVPPARIFREGDAVRFDAVTPGGLPAQVVVFKSPAEYRAFASRAHAAAAAGRPVSTEGSICVGHNTPAAVRRVEAAPAGGRDVQLAEVTLRSGTLEGSRFWVSTLRLRPAGDPDPAEEMRAAAAPPARPAPAGAGDLIARRRAKKAAAQARTLDREAADAIAAARAARDYEKMYREMLPYMLEDQRQLLERMSAAERNAALQRMAGAMEKQAGYSYPGQSPTVGPYR